MTAVPARTTLWQLLAAAVAALVLVSCGSDEQSAQGDVRC